MSEGAQIRVMIVDDHALVRSGLEAFLSVFEDFTLVGQAKNGQQALTMCEQEQPDVVLMDLIFGDSAGGASLDGVEATRRIKQRFPHVNVIALTSFKDQELVKGALQAGAIGYLLKDVCAEDLANAIRSAYAGRPTLSPEATQALIQSSLRSPAVGDDLTNREREVLDLMIGGLNNPKIAERLVISPGTVKFHVSNIVSKLGVSSRTEAVSVALQNKLIR